MSTTLRSVRRSGLLGGLLAGLLATCACGSSGSSGAPAASPTPAAVVRTGGAPGATRAPAVAPAPAGAAAALHGKVCTLLTTADVATVAMQFGAGVDSERSTATVTSSTCEWGDFTRGGLLLAFDTYPDATTLQAVRAKLQGSTVAGLGTFAVRQRGAVFFAAGNTLVSVNAIAGTPAALTALAKKVAARL